MRSVKSSRIALSPSLLCAFSAAFIASAVEPSGATWRVLPARSDRPATRTYVPPRPTRWPSSVSAAPSEPPAPFTTLRGITATYIGPASLSVIRARSSSASLSDSLASASGST